MSVSSSPGRPRPSSRQIFGSWVVFPVPTLVCLMASGLTAVYAVRLFNRVGFGRLDNARADWISTRWSERAPAMALTLLVIPALYARFGRWLLPPAEAPALSLAAP